MKLSQTGFETNKISSLDEQFPAQDGLLQTGQLVQFASGIFGYGNVPLRVMRNIEKIIREVLDDYGCVEISLPKLQPETLWQETGRWNDYLKEDALLTVRTDKGNFALAPTAEEAVTAFARGRVKSYKSLPVVFYQIGDKYRNEMRNRGYLLRGKEFNMMDAYSFDQSEHALDATYRRMKDAYMEIFKRLGFEMYAVAADSGAIGGDNCEEFMFPHPTGEDKIYIHKKTGKGYNIEVLGKYGIKDLSEYEEKRSIEFGHIFQIGKAKYAEKMNANYVDIDGTLKPFWMGCYGIGVSRLVAAIYEANVIKGGVCLPTCVAPYLVHIVAKQDKITEATKLYNKLRGKGITCILDDRLDVTLGAKIGDVKIFGTPYMIVVGDKELEIENMRTGERSKEIEKCIRCVK